MLVLHGALVESTNSHERPQRAFCAQSETESFSPRARRSFYSGKKEKQTEKNVFVTYFDITSDEYI